MMRLAGPTLIALLLCPAWVRAETDEQVRERKDVERVERTKDEARAVLAAVLRDDDIQPTPCRFDKQWLSTPVRADIAQTYLGSSLDADVTAPHLGIGPSDIIDPNETMRGIFCFSDEAEALTRQMADDFRSGAFPGERDLNEGRPVGTPRLRMNRTTFTMPVFDRTFTTAAVVSSFFIQSLRRTDAETARRLPRMFDEAGYSRHFHPEGVGLTYVYRKQDGRWTRIHQSVDWTAN